MRVRERFGPAALLLVLVPMVAQTALAFEGQVTTRTFQVDTPRLVALLGGEATSPEAVFDLPMERLEALAAQAGSGVQSRTQSLSLRGNRGRLDGLGKDGTSYILIDVEGGRFQLVRPGNPLAIEWGVSPEKAEATARLPELKRLGRTEKRRGFRSEAFETRQGDRTVRVWVSGDNEDLAALFRRAAELQQEMQAATEGADPDVEVRLAASRRGLPVLVQTYDPRGLRVYELFSVQPQKQPAAAFELPVGVRAVPPVKRPEPAGAEGRP